MPAARTIAAAIVSLVLASGSEAQRAAPAAPTPTAAPVLRIEGVVKDATGKPVEKALVMAAPRATANAAPAAHARTDASGRFTVVVPRHGEYLLRVEASGLAPHTVERMAVPAAPLVIVLRKGATVEGVVRDARGRPVAGARVEARERRWGLRLPALPLDSESGRVRTVTDARGAFRLEALGMAAHEVVASAAGLGGARRDGMLPGATLELFLTPGATVRGTVRGPDGRPLPGATVTLEFADRRGQTTTERTGADGAFEFWGVAAGEARLVAARAGAAPAAAELVLQRHADQVVHLSLGPAARVRGRIVDESDRAVPGGSVVLQEVDGVSVAATLGEVLRAEPDANGRFVIEGVPRAALALGLTARGYAPRRVEAAAAGAELDLGDVVVERGLAIVGRVRDESGRGIADAEVKAFAGGTGGVRRTTLETITEADGRFALGGVEQDVYSIYASAAGFAPATLRAPAGGEPLELVLSRAGSVTGTVVDEKGTNVPAFDVVATSLEEGESRRPAFADGSDGRFHVEDLGAAEWTLQISASGKAEATVSGVKVRTGAATDVGRIRLTPGASIKGRVGDGAGSPVAGANVWTETPGRMRLVRSGTRGTFTDTTGAFELRGVEPGRLDVVATHPDYAPGRMTGLEVDPARGAADARITLTAGGRIEGTVRRRDGRPLERLRVQVSGMGSARFHAQADMTAEGTFAVEHVPSSTVRVVLLAAVGDNAYAGVQHRQVEVAEGATAAVDFVLRDILVGGTVTRRGQPAAGFRVTLRGMSQGSVYGAPSGQVPAPPSGPQRGWAVTRQDGTYELVVSEPGPYSASVTSADSRLSYPSRRVHVPDADSYTLDLAVGGSGVSGQAVDAETGAPVQARVGALGAAGAGPAVTSAMTTADGRFHLELEPGEYMLLARAEGYASEKVPLKVDDKGAADVRIALARGETIAGRVVDATGRGARSMMVTAFAEEEGGGAPLPAPPRELTFSGPDGRFVVNGLGQGRHTLAAGDEHSGFGILPGVEPGSSDVTLRLAPGGRLRTLVRRADGSPASAAFVSVIRVDGRPFTGRASGSTDAEGVAEWGVPAGALEVRAAHQHEDGVARVTVAAGETAALEIRLKARGQGAPQR